jgi:hypothetical protein
MEGMGYSLHDAQLLATPPFVFAAIFAFTLTIIMDWKRSFVPFIVFPVCVAIVGLCMVCFLIHHYSVTVIISHLFLFLFLLFRSAPLCSDVLTLLLPIDALPYLCDLKRTLKCVLCPHTVVDI